MKTMELSNDKQHLSDKIIQLLEQLDCPHLIRIGDLSVVTELERRDCYGDILSDIDTSIFVHETFVFNVYVKYGQTFYYSGTHVYNNIQVLQAVVEELQKRTQED